MLLVVANKPATSSTSNRPRVRSLQPPHCITTDTSVEQGLGADNAPGHTDGHKPGEAPVASDSGSTYVGVRAGDNLPGEEGIKGKPVDTKPDQSNANMK